MAFYHSLNLNIIFCKKELGNIILNKFSNNRYANINDFFISSPKQRKILKQFIKKLIALGMLVKNDYADQNIIRDYRRSLKKSNKIKTLYVSLSYKCNLACKYCISNALADNLQLNKSLDMDRDIAKKSIDYFLKYVDKKGDKEMVLYGGEPLINWPILRFMVCYLRDKEAALSKKHSGYKQARIILCTNGTLLTKEIGEFLKKYNIYPAVTLDGFKVIHNSVRVTKISLPTFDIVKNNYKLLEKLKFPLGLTLTLGRHNYRHLPQIIKFFSKNFKAKTLATNIMINYEVENNPYVVSGTELAPALISAFKTAREYGTYLVKYVMDNRVKPFVEKLPRLKGCTGTGRRIMVLPNGSLAPCMAFASASKVNVLNKPPLNSFIGQYLKDHSPVNLAHCLACSAVCVCGGGCPYNSYRKFKDIKHPDSDTCYISQRFLTWLIWDIFRIITIKKSLKNNYFLVPTVADRRKIYGKIKVYSNPLDFQYTPNIVK